MTHFGLLGKSLGHSFSKKYFSDKFAKEGIDAEYHLHELSSINELPALLQAQPLIRGLNVTIPYKTEVLPYLKSLSPEAEAVGAVNTIRVEADGLSGHNSDVYGFRVSLEELLLGTSISQALILGTGGAAKAVVFVLKQMNIPYLMVSRTPKAGQVSYEEVKHMGLAAYPLIINTTPLGMYPHIASAPTLPYSDIGERHFVYDLIYNPAETKLMTLAREQGAKVCNGMDMLVLQAERSWQIWHEPSTDS